MHIVVTDRETIESGLRVRSAYVVISIYDPDRRRPKVRRQAGLRDVLQLGFHDAEPTETMVLPPDIKLMTPEHAARIVQFVRKHRANVGGIVVHCEQGMSRSPAVAAAISKLCACDGRRFWKEYQPNQFVYRLVMEAAGLTDEVKDPAAASPRPRLCPHHEVP